jgi:hypothetical protein
LQLENHDVILKNVREILATPSQEGLYRFDEITINHHVLRRKCVESHLARFSSYESSHGTTNRPPTVTRDTTRPARPVGTWRRLRSEATLENGTNLDLTRFEDAHSVSDFWRLRGGPRHY